MQPPTKRRRTEPVVVEEINFDTDARQEYLTGFHKRKLQRAKHARELAEKKARADRIEDRKRLREERKADLERHVEEINALLRPLHHIDPDDENEHESEETTVWEGIAEPAEIDHEAEYIDEDRYTTVTVETMDVTKEGLYKAEEDGKPLEEAAESKTVANESEKAGDTPHSKRRWTKEKPKDKADHPKKKKQKFRYESKAERKFTRVKQRSKNSKQASARREVATNSG